MRHVELALDIKANLGECPRWDERRQRLYWVDINAFELHCFDPSSGRDECLSFGEEIGCFSLRPDNGFVLAMRSGFYLLDGWNTDRQPLSDPEAHLQHNRFNDGRCDARGRFLAGSYYPPKDHDAASLWSLDSDLSVTCLQQGLLTANGAAFSPDNRHFYLADTPKHVIYQYDYDIERGSLANRREFHRFPHGQGRPDGAAIDAEGYYWTALYEGSRIVRLNPQGEIVEEIAIPAKCPTMPAFGGKDLRTLFITTVGNRPDAEQQHYPHAGGIFQVDVDVPGLVEHRFAR